MSRRKEDQAATPGAHFVYQGEVGTMTLRGRISVSDAEEVLVISRRALAEKGVKTVKLQCEAVEHTDLSSLQILLALCHALKEEQREVEIALPAHASAKQAFRLVGLVA